MTEQRSKEIPNREGPEPTFRNNINSVEGEALSPSAVHFAKGALDSTPRSYTSSVASEKRKTSGKKGKTPRNENARAIDAAVHASANFCTEMDEFAAKLDYKMASSVKPIACTTIPTLGQVASLRTPSNVASRLGTSEGSQTPVSRSPEIFLTPGILPEFNLEQLDRTFQADQGKRSSTASEGINAERVDSKELGWCRDETRSQNKVPRLDFSEPGSSEEAVVSDDGGKENIPTPKFGPKPVMTLPLRPKEPAAAAPMRISSPKRHKSTPAKLMPITPAGRNVKEEGDHPYSAEQYPSSHQPAAISDSESSSPTQARSHEEHTSAFLGPSFSQRLDEVAAEEEGGIEPADEENQPESEEGGDHLGSGEENQLKPTEETHPETAKKEGQPKPAATPHPKPAQEQVPQPRSPIRSERYAEHWPKGEVPGGKIIDAEFILQDLPQLPGLDLLPDPLTASNDGALSMSGERFTSSGTSSTVSSRSSNFVDEEISDSSDVDSASPMGELTPGSPINDPSEQGSAQSTPREYVADNSPSLEEAEVQSGSGEKGHSKLPLSTGLRLRNSPSPPNAKLERLQESGPKRRKRPSWTFNSIGYRLLQLLVVLGALFAGLKCHDALNAMHYSLSQGGPATSFHAPMLSSDRLSALASPDTYPSLATLREKWQAYSPVSEFKDAADGISEDLGTATKDTELRVVPHHAEDLIPDKDTSKPHIATIDTPDTLKADLKLAHRPADAVTAVAEVNDPTALDLATAPVSSEPTPWSISGAMQDYIQPVKRLLGHSSIQQPKGHQQMLGKPMLPSSIKEPLSSRDSILTSQYQGRMLGQLHKYSQLIVGGFVGLITLGALLFLGLYTILSADLSENGNSEEESKEAVIVIGGDEVGLVSTPPLQATPTASEVKDDDSDRDSSVSRSVSKSVSHVTRSVSRSLRSATRSVQRTSKRMTSVAKSLSQSLAQGDDVGEVSSPAPSISVTTRSRTLKSLPAIPEISSAPPIRRTRRTAV